MQFKITCVDDNKIVTSATFESTLQDDNEVKVALGTILKFFIKNGMPYTDDIQDILAEVDTIEHSKRK